MITVVGNLKGGCGKSTVTFNLAVWLANRRQKVVAFDLDPQATLSDVAEVRSEIGQQPVVRVFRPENDPVKLIKQYEDGEILVDVGSANLWAMRQALQLAQRILVPVPPSQADVWATQRFLHIVEETSHHRSHPPEILMFLNRADTHPGQSESEETEEILATLKGVHMVKHRLCQRTAYRRSFSEGMSVFEQEANSKAAEEFNALAAALYPKLARTRTVKAASRAKASSKST